MPSFVATAAVTWQFTGTSQSAARVIPTAHAIVLCCVMFDSTGDTISATIAGATPVASYQGNGAVGSAYLAVFTGVPTGSQTVVVQGASSGLDVWCCGLRGLDNGDLTTPFDGQVTDSASPASINVTTTADGLACGVVYASDATVATTDTEVMEHDDGAGSVLAVASAPGTGGAVSIDWSGGGALEVAIAVNLRHAAGGGGGGPIPGSGGWGWPRFLGASIEAAAGSTGGAYYLLRRRREGKTRYD